MIENQAERLNQVEADGIESTIKGTRRGGDWINLAGRGALKDPEFREIGRGMDG